MPVRERQSLLGNRCRTRRNISAIAAEAHRVQYDFIDGYARHMRDALAHASFNGYTGTPIELPDANTRAVFVDYISVYDIHRAVQAGAMVPIYSESRLAAALGVPAADAGIAAELSGALRTAVWRGILVNTRGRLQIAARTIGDYQRDLLKEHFVAALPGRQWVERVAALRNFARWLGFKRTGKAIDDSARSVINGLLREGRLASAGTQIRREL